MDYSNGQRLLHELGLEQCSTFSCSYILIEQRLAWSDSFAKKDLRNVQRKLKDSSVFLVLSQNCDIACPNDHLDSCVEIAICKKLKEKELHVGNMFVSSARKLQFSIADTWYEASIDLILTVEKGALYKALTDNNIMLTKPTDDLLKTVPLWKANRYMRTALPDMFNKQLFSILYEHLEKLQAVAKDPQNLMASFLRAFYVKVSPLNESDYYVFSFFALLRSDTTDELVTEIQSLVEDFALELEETSNFTDESDMYADRDSNTYLSYLNPYLRLNLDSHSLKAGDTDIEPSI